MGFPRVLNAGNAGPFTLDGTRTYLIGDRRIAVVDPGPDSPSHIQAIAGAVSDAEEVFILLTHGHPDHSGAAAVLAERLQAPVLGPGLDRGQPLADGDRVDTDQGTLIVLHTPGHTSDHLSFHWPDEAALFAGDLILGEGSTTWVAGYAGCVADYFRSLSRIRELGLDRIYPAHGPPILEVTEAIDLFEAHRRERIRQVGEVLESNRSASLDQIVDRVYGEELPGRMRGAARESVEAILDYLS